ncbi:unnamed protein product [Amaranthus hypochondriacus]
MADAWIKYIPSNTFSYYDQVLDTTAMLGAVPPRFGWNGGEIGLDVYFSKARGNATVLAMDLTKWNQKYMKLNTNASEFNPIVFYICTKWHAAAIALAIKDEVEDLEKACITVNQIDKAALKEDVPLRKTKLPFYLDWAVHSFSITNVGVQDTTQIRKYSEVKPALSNMVAAAKTVRAKLPNTK